VEALKLISEYGHLFLQLYDFDIQSGEWTHLEAKEDENPLDLEFEKIFSIQNHKNIIKEEPEMLFDDNLEVAKKIIQEILTDYKEPEYIKWDEDIEKGAFFYAVNTRGNCVKGK